MYIFNKYLELSNRYSHFMNTALACVARRIKKKDPFDRVQFVDNQELGGCAKG